jgi:hypothetical protein
VPSGDFNFQTTDNEWVYGKSYSPGQIIYVTTDKDPFRTWYICNAAHIASENTFPGLDDAPWEKDGCSKTIGACRKRFAEQTITYNGLSGDGVGSGSYTVSNTVPSALTASISGSYLPFGGFPATDKYQYGQSFRQR